MKRLLLISLALAALATAHAAEPLVPFNFSIDKQTPGAGADRVQCSFEDLKLPASDIVVYAAGAYAGRTTGFQIDQSGHEATQIDVAVHQPDKPVVLMLGAYEPTVWSVGWSAKTRIAAVLLSGYHRQAVAGLEPGTPLIVSSYDNKGPCGYFYVTPEDLKPLNPIAKRLFGRPVGMVFPAIKGKVVVGLPLAAGTPLKTSSAVKPEHFRDLNAPLAGPAGVADALRRGLLRRATASDADAWADAVGRAAPAGDIPPVAGQSAPRRHKPALYNTYVVLKPFHYPAGLYGGNSAVFLIPKGVPQPDGNPGHSEVYDFNTLVCSGPSACNN